jgi:hypothetical protein
MPQSPTATTTSRSSSFRFRQFSRRERSSSEGRFLFSNALTDTNRQPRIIIAHYVGSAVGTTTEVRSMAEPIGDVLTIAESLKLVGA